MHLLKAKLTNWLKTNERAGRNLLLIGITGVGGLLYLRVWLPLTGIGIPCVFHEVTGLWCPGCGFTRLLLSLMEFDLIQAFRYNMLVFFLAPIFLAYIVLLRRGKKRQADICMGAMVAMTIAFGVLRNLPSFSWLAPAQG